MNPSESAHHVLQSLETVSGKRVLIQTDPSISGFASIKIATKDASAHLLRYKPEFESVLPYLTAFQCGFALRTLQADPKHRFDLASKPAMLPDALRSIEDHLRNNQSGIPISLAPQLAQQLGHGIGLQLRSMPIAIRVDAWLVREYPSLAPMQRLNVERQLHEAMQALGPSVRAFAPQAIIDANAGMSSAFTKFWARTWNEPEVAIPFVSAGYGTMGDALLHLVESLDSTPNGDRAVVDAWIKRLELNHWFHTIDSPS